MPRPEAPVDPASLPAAPGSYVLELVLDREITLRPGKLGEIRLGPGRLRYYGSARGPGGVRSRVARHLAGRGKRHWHVDWLLARAPVREVTVELEASECDLVRRDLKTKRWAVAAKGFGSSDCRSCPAHLLARRWLAPRPTEVIGSSQRKQGKASGSSRSEESGTPGV